jgi:acetoin utilization deacetylase AcuC-like enzyme
MMTLLIVGSDRFGGHTPPPGHPERPDRQDVMHAVTQQWRRRGAVVAEPDAATRDQILRVHSAQLVETLEASAGRAVMMDPDTFTSPESWDVTRLAAGAAVGAVDAVLGGSARRAMALVRPPGHHSGPDRARGFCLVNGVAVAAAHALERGVERVAIVDFDVHHGNGTQEIFETDPRILFVSAHQWPHYPGTGAADEVGRGEGRGFTVNVPIECGATDADYDTIFRDLVIPITCLFEPGLLLVSAGFDAHEQDPLGGMRLTAGGFARLTQHLVAAADMSCDGRIVLVTEGGYNLAALGASLDATLGALQAGGPVPGDLAAIGDAPTRGRAAIGRAYAVQSQYWRRL